MDKREHDLVVIGAGPGGYVAAIRAAQLGLDVACIEAEDRLGGTCLRVGCIPSKALLESSEKFHEANKELGAHGISVDGVSLDLSAMLQRKDKIVADLTGGIAGLFKKNNVTHYSGMGRITEPGKVVVDGEAPAEISAKHIIIATGSKPRPLAGVDVDGKVITGSDEALAYDSVPEHLVVIGAGYIGLELGSVWHRLGAKVTILEYMDHIMPGMDLEISKEALRIFKKQKMKFILGAKVTGASVAKGKVTVEIEGKDSVTGDKALVVVGRVPRTEGLGLESAGVTTDETGRISVDQNYATNVPGIYAIGDVIAGPMLAHKASDEGVACVEKIVMGYGHINYDAIPGVAYTMPEIASVGKTEEQLKETGVDYKVGKFLFRANGRARALNTIDGKVKILADATSDRVLGVHIIGNRAGDLIAECTMAIEFGASAEDIARVCHAHPTLSEIIKEAALDVNGQMIHS